MQQYAEQKPIFHIINPNWNVISYMNTYFILVISTCLWLKVLQRLPRGLHIRKGPSPLSTLTGKSPAVMVAAPSKAISLKNGVMTNLTLKELTSDSAQPHLFWLKIDLPVESGSCWWWSRLCQSVPQCPECWKLFLSFSCRVFRPFC